MVDASQPASREVTGFAVSDAGMAASKTLMLSVLFGGLMFVAGALFERSNHGSWNRVKTWSVSDASEPANGCVEHKLFINRGCLAQSLYQARACV